MPTSTCMKQLPTAENDQTDNYDREKELKAFDDSKEGVKGLIDAHPDGAITKIPKIFIRPPEDLAEERYLDSTCQADLEVPTIDLTGLDDDPKNSSRRREMIVEKIRLASGEWGFFQLVNHGIPSGVLDGMISSTRVFHEQDSEVKRALYSKDMTKRVRFDSNFDLYVSRNASWRDSLYITVPDSDDGLHPDELPESCRAEALEYIKHMTKLGETLFGLISEALGLKRNHLTSLECGKGRSLVCHYHPACPEPELTLGGGKHTDLSFITILLQDQIGVSRSCMGMINGLISNQMPEV